jgi:hypothetical protein
MNYSDIKQELKDHWEQFASNREPGDLLNEFADSACPVYYGEIIKDWQEMPSAFSDVWAEEGYTSDSITALMAYDLYNYYNHEYYKIYQELCEEMEPANA